MSAPVVVDLLEDAIARAKYLLTTGSTKQRVHALWAVVKQARYFGAADVVHAQFMQLAIEVGLIDARGYWTGKDVRRDIRKYGREDIAHVIRWAQRGMNPFEKGPLR